MAETLLRTTQSVGALEAVLVTLGAHVAGGADALARGMMTQAVGAVAHLATLVAVVWLLTLLRAERGAGEALRKERLWLDCSTTKMIITTDRFALAGAIPGIAAEAVPLVAFTHTGAVDTELVRRTVAHLAMFATVAGRAETHARASVARSARTVARRAAVVTERAQRTRVLAAAARKARRTRDGRRHYNRIIVSSNLPVALSGDRVTSTTVEAVALVGTVLSPPVGHIARHVARRARPAGRTHAGATTREKD